MIYKLKLRGFTLAEVLITLGIIGIVAAITIPGVMTAYKKHVIATSLKRAVSAINQVIKISGAENGEMETWDKTLPPEEYINTYIRPYIKVIMTCNSMTKCGYNSSVSWHGLNGAIGSYSNANHAGRTPFITADGILYTFSHLVAEGHQEDNDKVIIIDINGAKEPNKFGQDVFVFYRIEGSNSIIPYGSDKSREEILQDCSPNGYGYYCAVLIRENGWKIPSGYPLK